MKVPRNKEHSSEYRCSCMQQRVELHQEESQLGTHISLKETDLYQAEDRALPVSRFEFEWLYSYSC